MDSQLIDFSLPSEYTSMLEERTKERDAGMMNINLILVLNSQYSFYLLPYRIHNTTNLLPLISSHYSISIQHCIISLYYYLILSLYN